jgi:2-methylfumaryl-CoA isomerase
LEDVAKVFDECGVCWGPYQTFRQLLDDDWRASKDNPMFEDILQPGIGQVRAPGSPLSFSAVPRTPPGPAPILGQHTEQILAEDLRMSDAEIGRLHDAGIVASPSDR